MPGKHLFRFQRNGGGRSSRGERDDGPSPSYNVPIPITRTRGGGRDAQREREALKAYRGRLLAELQAVDRQLDDPEEEVA